MDIKAHSFVGQILQYVDSHAQTLLNWADWDAQHARWFQSLRFCWFLVCVIHSSINKVKSPSPKRNKCWGFAWKVAVCNEHSLVWEIQNIRFVSVLLNKWWSRLRSGVCSIDCVSAFWSTECPLQWGKCLWVCVQRAAGGICVSVLFTSWLRRQRLEWRCNVCTLLSSLYSNDRPCCFTCCGGRSVALSLRPSL